MLLSYIRTVILYLVLIAVVRLMGKRQIGEMEPTEFVVTMLVSNLAAIPMQDGGIPLYSGLVPILTVLGVELVLASLCLRSVRFRRLMCGKPVILIDNGTILRQNLRRTRVTLDELTEMLRQQNILRPETVQFAILETNGKLSVFPYPKYKPASAKDAGVIPKPQHLPYTIIADGYVYRENLSLSGHNDAWLAKLLGDRDCKALDVFLLTVDDGDRVVCIKKEDAH
jgi:uncharacterized membrane protein YcaP (DUF421 family)